ncbi:MAG: hypothetical protein E7560_02320 [Ruminococcaceae bacterium]|nr:hypothetical protein [Oscillospiraceae bacterium]
MQNWKVIYSCYEGAEKRAVELIYGELGEYVLRDSGIYSFRSLACVDENSYQDSNAVVLGTYDKNSVLQKFFKREEIKEKGYAVKVIDNPYNNDYKLALLCGDSSAEVFYAAVDFVDDYFAKATPFFDGIHLKNELFTHKLPDYYISTSPSFKTRSVFTWGHPINDYEEYFANLARLKLNQVIIWNDYLPINADDIVDCAHSYGIEVLWGFAWGWGFNCKETDITDLNALKNSILEEYNKVYKNVKGDGIYFQSFTELSDDTINGVRISQAVTELVNMTADEILRENPQLHIQFGLHATSVCKHMNDIANVDSRVEIVWENCGKFPYNAPLIGDYDFDSLEDFKSQHNFTDEILDLRDSGDVGIVYKCMLTMDWSRGRVTHQPNNYVMGKMNRKTMEQDIKLINEIWRFYTVEWIENGEYAYELTKHIKEKTNGKANMCLAGMFSGGIWYPTALNAQMFWNCDEDFKDVRRKVINRSWVKF